jgi:predicted nuclease with TOPRIM domain
VSIQIIINGAEISQPDKLGEVLEELRKFKEEIVSRLEEFQNAIHALSEETTRIGDLIDDLQERLKRDDLTDEQEQEVLAQLHQAADRLRALGTDPENPVPPVEG